MKINKPLLALFAMTLLCGCAEPVAAQTVPPDVIISGTGEVLVWKAKAADTGAIPATIGVMPCGTAPSAKTDFLAFVDLSPPYVGTIVNGSYVMAATADRCFEAYAMDASGRFSAPSPNQLLFQVVPQAPILQP